MHKIDPAISTIALAGFVAIAVGIGAGTWTSRTASEQSMIAGAAHAESQSAPHQWAASATGRVEPRTGEVRVASQVPGKIVEVLASTNDKVEAGDLLVRLDDQDIYAKITAAAAEVGVRQRELQDEPAKGLALEREQGVDAVAAAERALFAARESFDAAVRVRKDAAGDKTAAEKVIEARKGVDGAKAALTDARAKLATIVAKPDMPHETRLESSLALARSDMSSAEIALERTRVRAPASGTILNMVARAGETAVPSPESALLVFGDLSSLRLRAEVEERDAAKVRVGQAVVIKADAFPDREFTGTVTSISQSLGA
ncbi:MAG: efflux RND transporter periplasmic adaptor subunit, partial [Hyphomicrobium sp.]